MFDRFIILYNPASTFHQRAEHWVVEIKRLFPNTPLDVITTLPNGQAANAAQLLAQSNKLGPKTLLCIAAGDGTASFVVNFLTRDRRLSDKARATPILPLWCGNGNDLACMLNGSRHIMDLDRVFEHGQIVPIHPLSCHLTNKYGNTSDRIAINYIGFGASAQMCKRLNEPKHRRSVLHHQGFLGHLPGGVHLQTLATTWHALVESPTYTIEEGSDRHRDLYERTFYNGPRVAKYYRQPVQLLDDFFYMDTWEGKTILTPLGAILSFRHRIFSRSKDTLRKQATFLLTKSTWAQFDGEVSRIHAGTKIEVSISTQPIYPLSTMLDVG